MAVGLFNDFDPVLPIPSNQYGLSTKTITRGTLLSFYYPQSLGMKTNVIHDPYPMVIITDIWPKYIRGINLHYLTFPYIKRILTTFGNTGLSYFNIRPDRYLANAFRMYVRMGMRQAKKLDTEFLLTVLGSVRTFSPGELEQIKQNIQAQIQARLQAKADEMTSYEQWRAGLNPVDRRTLTNKVNQTQQVIQGGSDQQSPTNQPQQGLNTQQPMPEDSGIQTLGSDTNV